MFSHHIYPVPHLLLQKSTLYPSFLLSSFFFSLICVTCCFSMYGAVWNLIFLSTSSALLLFDAFHFCLTLLHSTYIMTGAFTLIVAVVLVLVFSCFPIWTLWFSFRLSLLHSFFPSVFVLYSIFPIFFFILHVLSLNLWFVLFICFISLFV